MKKSIFLLLCISVLFSCTKKEDFFDPHHIDEEAKENFPVKDIDPSQDWNMAAVGTLSVSINQKTGEVYTVKVYTDNPLNSEGNARLLAKKTGVRDGETVLFTFDAPKAIESVYVLFEDKMYNGWVKVADMKVGRPSVSWEEQGSEAGKRSAMARSSWDYKVPDEKNFLKEVPADAKQYPIQWAEMRGGYYMNDGSYELRYGNYTLYIKGNVTITGAYPDGLVVYLLEGSTLDATAAETFNPNTGFYIAQNSTMKLNRISINCSLYNKGKITVAGASNSSGGYIYNDGSFEITGKTTFAMSGKATFVNLQSASLQDVTMTGGSELINEEGTVKANSLDTRSSYIYNRCRMEILSSTYFQNGEGFAFEQDGGSSFETNTLKTNGNIPLRLGSKSVFHVKDNVEYQNGKVDVTGVGSDEKALFWVSGVCIKTPDESITYSGELEVALKGYTGDTNFSDGAQLVKVEQVRLGEPVGCGYNYTTNGGGTNSDATDIPQVYTYVFEDMTREAGDFDFNDVVLKVTVPDESGKATVTLFAAGAAKNLKVGFTDTSNGSYSQSDLFGEVHAAMNCDPGTLINTGSGPNGTSVEKEITITGTLKDNGDFYIYEADNANNITIHVASQVTPASTYPPYGLCIPGDWVFPRERNQITALYRYFANWAQNHTIYTRWYEEHMSEFKEKWDAANGEYPYADK